MKKLGRKKVWTDKWYRQYIMSKSNLVTKV